MKKAGRNDPCPCGSGKKFKKCCESKMISKRFTASKTDTTSSSSIQKLMGMSSLFQSQLQNTPKKPIAPPSQTPDRKEEISSPEKERIC